MAFTFGLPPSLGVQPVRELAREFADVLYAAGFSTVLPMKTYEALQAALIAGEIDAAWGPPIVCARVEAAGGAVGLRALRGGAATYRAALVSRANDVFDVTSLTAGVFRPRAVWVDRWSMAGYLLPRALLRAHGLDLAAALLGERLVGSYAACIDALLDFEADLTSTFISAVPGATLAQAWPDRAHRLKMIALSDASPNDGVVLSPALAPPRTQALLAGLDKLLANARSRGVLAASFKVDGFDRPPPATYAPLLALLDA